jgi:hypothetical protein
MVMEGWERLLVDMATLLPMNTSKSLPRKNIYHQMNPFGIGFYHFHLHHQRPGTDNFVFCFCSLVKNLNFVGYDIFLDLKCKSLTTYCCVITRSFHVKNTNLGM